MAATTRGSRKGTLTGLPDWLLLLGSALVYVFLYAPIAVLIFFSFNSTRSTQIWTGFSFEWYGQLLGDPTILQALRTSLTVGVFATLSATVIGTMTALALSRHRFRGQSVADTAIYAATVMPETVVGGGRLVSLAGGVFLSAR